MKFHQIFLDYLNCSDEKATFNLLSNSLAESITGWDYFVNWAKAKGNVRDFEIDLNTLNYLIGKGDIETEFRNLIIKQPSIIKTIPILIACRESNFSILSSVENGHLNHKKYSFVNKKDLSSNEINDICEFALNSGILEIFQQKTIKSVPDYVFGIEVGLDSNGRKNRCGTTMESIVENILKQSVKKNGFEIMAQATSEKIYRAWGLSLQVDKSSRRFDFAVKTSTQLYLIETNYYGGGGSKLKATAGEYQSLFDYLSNQNHRFIWITDGLGWKSTLRPLEESFNHLDFVLNLHMAIAVAPDKSNTLIEEILVKGI